MARSFAHRWGQIVGNVIEGLADSLLRDIAQKHGMFLDSAGQRPARRGTKVAWADKYGNSHDLDYVIEEGGSDDKRGIPRAFIEVAWRRHTKHSRNKVQEIEGAVGPVAETYHSSRPFLGAILAGVFTKASLSQLVSKGFQIIYIPYEAVVAAFGSIGVDARYGEETEEAEHQDRVAKWGESGRERQEELFASLRAERANEIGEFSVALEEALSRVISSVVVAVLSGTKRAFRDVESAVEAICGTGEVGRSGEDDVERIEISVRYNNGDRIEGLFRSRSDAVSFLGGFR